MRSGFIALGGIIVLLFSAAGGRGEEREEVKSEDELIELKFNDVYGNKIEKFQCPDLSRENSNIFIIKFC